MRERVLAIDADPFILSIIKSTLESAGYKVFTALDGQNGLEQFHYRYPDLVILDVMLPHLDGWDICHRIRKLSQIPLIIHTTVESPDYLSRAAKAGVCHYLLKPLLPKILISYVEMTLKPQQQRESVLSQLSRSLPLPELAIAGYV